MRTLLLGLVLLNWVGFVRADEAKRLQFTLQDRVETSDGSGRYHVRQTSEAWDPKATAIIICDVWDAHHCLRAVQRVEEFGPRLNQVITKLRDDGVTVIHAPSDCMKSYESHPGRARAIAVPKSATLPKDITSWCRKIPSEEKGSYPVDQSDGGEDDEAAEHAEWHKTLAARGRNPKLPWVKQADLITIDDAKDFVSDKGDEVWSILESRGIKNVILAGVHTNMCVLGRPFGLRQMAQNGKHVVLLRDMTDTMYNPARWPYVSHFTGTDLIVEHVEKFVCPTMTSDQVLGGTPFRFKNDHRPSLAILVAEDEYKTERTLPVFAANYLNRDFRVRFIFGSDAERNSIPDLAAIDAADMLLVSARRRVLKPEAMEHLKKFVESGKPILGIRTASHAWSLRNQPIPEGFVAWPEWDAQVFGGNYTNHYGNGRSARVSLETNAVENPLVNPLVRGLPTSGFITTGSLYQVSPLKTPSTVLITGEIEGASPEPMAWIFQRAGGGKSFYTSLGNAEDFENPAFQRLLYNAVYWAAGLPIPEIMPAPGPVPDRKV
jgi:nicotinamidase-related amidase/type 1 glutamine amidotransferase